VEHRHASILGASVDESFKHPTDMSHDNMGKARTATLDGSAPHRPDIA
jgi:hypothetical protein